MPKALAVFEGPQNLSTGERAISVIAGLGLAAAATKPRPNPVLNIAGLLGGAYLAFRGATGRCPLKQALVAALEGAGPELVPVPVKAQGKRARRVARR